MHAMRTRFLVMAMVVLCPLLALASHIHSTRAEKTLEEMLGRSGLIERLILDGQTSDSVSKANQGKLIYDQANQCFAISTNGAAYQCLSTAVSGAPSNATYITQTPNTTLTNEQALSTLDTGALLNTNGTGVLSVYSGGACTNQFVRSINASLGLTCASVSLTADVTGTLPVGNGGTGTNTAFTSGSIVFAGSSGVYSQDNANLFWNNSSKRFGIGTNVPNVQVHQYSLGSAVYRIESDATTGFAGLLLENDTGLILQSNNFGSASTTSLFGMTMASWSAIYNGGGTNNGMIIGTLSSSPIAFGTANVERMRITSTGLFGLLTTNPTQSFSFNGNASRTIWLERHTTADTAGNTLTVQAGGATSGATNRNGGDLILAPGIATGTGSSKVQIQSVIAGASGTADRSPATHWQLRSGHVETLGTTPTISAGCGTGASIVGNDNNGTVTTNASGFGTCTVTFANAWANTPQCVLNNQTSASVTRATSPGTTSFTITGASGGDVIDYICRGRA